MMKSVSKSQWSGVAMGAVLGMFWMRVFLGFSYVYIGFFMIFPVSMTIVVLTEERSLGPVMDVILQRVHSLIWMAMHADDAETAEDDNEEDHQCLPRPSDPSLDAYFKASNTSDLITSANNSLFSGIHIDLIDHAVIKNEPSAPVYLQDTTTGLFLKAVDGKMKMTATPDDTCLFEWVKGKTHHWGLLSTSVQKFVGQTMLSQIVASARKMQNWESFRILQNANLAPMENSLSCPIYMILCSARFGKGMWVSSRGREEDKLVVGMAKNFTFALSLRYSTSLDAFQTALPPPSISPLSGFPASFHEATKNTQILLNQLITPTSCFMSLSLFSDAYDTLLPEHQGAWQVHSTLGNVRQVTYPLHHLYASCVAHEFHNYRLEGDNNSKLVFQTKLILGEGLVVKFALELEYRLQLNTPSNQLQLSSSLGVHWSVPSMFEGYVESSATQAAELHAQHLITLLENQTPPRVVTNLGTLFVTSLFQQFDNPTYALSLPWSGQFFTMPLKPIYSGTWQVAPEGFLEKTVVDSAWFFRKREDYTIPSGLDMSPWSPHPTMGHVRLQRFYVPVAGKRELIEEYEMYSTPEPNTLQVGRKFYLAHQKPWTVNIRWDFEQLEGATSNVACAVSFHWHVQRPNVVDTEKHVIALMLASIERLRVLVTGQEELENMPWPDELTTPLVQGIFDV